MSIFKQWLAFYIWAILAIFVPSATFGYDLQERANNSYDGSIKVALAYDGGVVLATTESTEDSPGTCALLVSFAKFLAAEGGTTTLFRAVNPAELSDLSANSGVFRNLGSAEGKYFSTTAEGAGSYARQTFCTGLYEGPYTVVQTTIPSSSLTPVMRATVDRGISTIVVPNNLLPSLSPLRERWHCDA